MKTMLLSKIKQGQLSLEFVVLFAIGMLVLAIFLVFGNQLLVNKSDYQQYAALRDTGYSIQSELILAARAHEGYQRTFSIPPTIGQFNYSLTTAKDEFWISYHDQRISFRTPPLAGNLTKGINNITKNATTILIEH